MKKKNKEMRLSTEIQEQYNVMRERWKEQGVSETEIRTRLRKIEAFDKQQQRRDEVYRVHHQSNES